MNNNSNFYEHSGENILFLNPPGKQLYIRDYYCSKVSKANYMPQPIDLLMQTGHFAEKGYKLLVIDAIVERLSVSETIKQISAFNPKLIITQCGAVSFNEDKQFFIQLKKLLPHFKILSSGDIFIENPQLYLHEEPWLDGIITDFFSDAALQFHESNGTLYGNGIVTRKSGKEISKQPRKAGEVSLPRPRHELFKNEKYSVPFATKKPIATVLTSYACPYPCTFCIMSTLPYKRRNIDEVKQELLYLNKTGIKYIYFSDQTFYAEKTYTEDILKFMLHEKFNFSWMCYSRVDLMNEEKMQLLKRAGCNVLMFGVEWANDEYSKKYKKNYNTEQVQAAFRIAKKIGLKTMGTFLIGVPGQDASSIRKTIQFAIDLEADYAAFNVAIPRSNTSFRKEAIDLGLIKESDVLMDQSGSFIAMGTGTLNQNQIIWLKREAYIRFYLRPSYIFKRVRGIISWTELKTHFNEAIQMLFAQWQS
jgi:anaerobic magnesium-protoporphyrin IX monomethyl ester cyclase